MGLNGLNLGRLGLLYGRLHWRVLEEQLQIIVLCWWWWIFIILENNCIIVVWIWINTCCIIILLKVVQNGQLLRFVGITEEVIIYFWRCLWGCILICGNTGWGLLLRSWNVLFVVKLETAPHTCSVSYFENGSWWCKRKRGEMVMFFMRSVAAVREENIAIKRVT